MDRQQAIDIISGLYPVDSDHPDTRSIGRQLLQQAKEETDGWRNESVGVLIRYAELCQEMENRQTRELLRGATRTQHINEVNALRSQNRLK